MKKLYFLLALMSISLFSAKAQQPQIPNASFENWSADTLISWTTKFTLITPITLATKSTNFQDGQFALEATSQTVPLVNIDIPGIATLGKITADFVNMTAKAEGGVAFNGKPSKFKGWYQYNPQGTDSAMVYIILTKWNTISGTRDTVTDGTFVCSAAQATYSQFSTDLTYQTSLTPDTLNIIVLSSANVATPNSKFIIDNLTLEYPQGVANNDKLDCHIYPNPSSGLVNVSFASNESYTVLLHNTLGQQVYSKNINGMNSTLDFSSFPKGIYLLELKSDKLRTVKRITLK